MKHILLLSTVLAFTISSKAQTLKDAIQLNENEQQEEAAALYQQLIIKEPANGTIYYYYGENFIDAEQPEKAIDVFKKGLEKDPANPLNLIGQAELKLMTGDVNGGKTLIDLAVKNAAGKNALVLMEAGEAFMRYKKGQDLISAQTYLETAAKMDPKNPEVYNLLGDLYSELNNGTMAATNYNKALDIDKNQVKALLHKGQLYKRSTNYDGAKIEFENTLKINPNFAPAYRELGEVYFKQRQIEKAKENYKKYLELSKNNTMARLRYAFFLHESDDNPSAQAEINIITRVDSTNLYMMRIMAYVAYEINLNDTALKTIAKVFELTETDTSRRIGRDYAYYGKALAKAGNDSLGTDYLFRAIAFDQKNGDLYDDLGKMAMKAKKYDVAAKAYQDKIANVSKVTSGDFFSWGRALYSAKMYLEADSAFSKVTELSPTWPNGYLYRGRANGQLDSSFTSLSAVPHYQKYIDLISADSANVVKFGKELIEANSYIAFAYLKQKDCDNSLIYWKNVLALDPKIQQAIDAIKIIKESKDCK
ncbi:MAG: tetratricopeptide repeat protein [Bacteroidetes bacterium]|nr:tetratricopeptide repeat protein [Bacteroidota bacterium]